MTTTESPPMQAARAAIEQGQHNQARRQLRAILQQEPENYRAWLWLAGLTESATAGLEYVRRAHTLQPDDPIVAKALEWAEQRAATPSPAAETAPPRLVVSPPAIPKGMPVRAAPTPTEPPPTPWIEPPPPETTPPAAPTTTPPSPRKWGRTLTLLLIIVVALALLFLVIRWANRAANLAKSAEPRWGVTALAQAKPSADFIAGAGVPGRKSSDVAARVNAARAVAGNGVYAAWRRAEAGQTASALPADGVVTSVSAEIAPTSDPAARWIDVNLTTQTLAAYDNDTPVYQALISSGMWPHLTVTGQYHIYQRLESQTMIGYHLGYDYNLPNVPHVMYFYEDYALHGAYWHNNFGAPMSHGCVNLDLDTAAWLYNFASVGTLVNIHY